MQTRFLAALGTSWVLALLPALAAAQSTVRYTNAGQKGPVITETHQTTTRLVYEFYNNANTSIGTQTCSAPRSCTPRFPVGTAKYSVVLEYDPSREELLSETCKGVASTVPQGQCIDGNLSVTLRARWGTVKYTFVADSRPGRLYAPRYGGFGTDARLQFSPDGSKYWAATTVNNVPGGGFAIAVGNYKVVTPNMQGACKPVQTNPNDVLAVNEGRITEYTVRYTGTMCTMSINTSYGKSVAAGGTFTSQPERLNCPGVTNATSCKAEFPFDSTVRLIANAAPGYKAESFGRNFTGCSREEPNQAICEILADGDRELSSGFYLATTPPPPPPPVGLAFATSTPAPSAGVAAKGELGVPMLQLQATAQNGTAKVQALTVKASGSGRDDLDLLMVKVVVDANGNGVFDAGETVLAQGRPAADNGELRLGFGSELAVADTTRLLVVADIANEVRSASAAALGGATLAIAIGLFAMPATRRRRLVPATLVLIAISCLLLKGCGGGESASTEEPPVVAAPSQPPVVVPPPAPPVLLTYQLDLVAVEATDSATPAATLTVRALPVAGATITVQQ